MPWASRPARITKTTLRGHPVLLTDPYAGVAGSEPEGDLIIDKTEELIPIDMDSRGGSDCEIIEVITPLPVTTPVKKSKTKQKPIDQAMKLAAVKVSAAWVDDNPWSHLLF